MGEEISVDTFTLHNSFTIWTQLKKEKSLNSCQYCTFISFLHCKLYIHITFFQFKYFCTMRRERYINQNSNNNDDDNNIQV